MVCVCLAVCCICSSDIHTGKVGITGVNSNLATAIRTMVALVMAWGMVFLTNTQGGITAISKKKLAVSDTFRFGQQVPHGYVIIVLCR